MYFEYVVHVVLLLADVCNIGCGIISIPLSNHNFIQDGDMNTGSGCNYDKNHYHPCLNHVTCITACLNHMTSITVSLKEKDS